MMQLIDRPLLDAVTAQAKTSPRLRMNHNFHHELTEPVHRLLNAIEPGTYLPPHRHLDPDKPEGLILLRGRAALFIFDDDGQIVRTEILDPMAGRFGVDIDAGVWHGMLSLQSGSVIYEVKEGPYVPLAAENFAPWAPAATDTAAAAAYMKQLEQHLQTMNLL